MTHDRCPVCLRTWDLCICAIQAARIYRRKDGETVLLCGWTGADDRAFEDAYQRWEARR